MERHNLSGIYIFDTYPGEEKRQPTCIEDCQDETRQKWLEGLERDALIRCCNMLCGTIRKLGEQFSLYAE